MELPRNIICITSVVIASAFASLPARAGGGAPGCNAPGLLTPMVIEVNTLRAGGNVINTSPNKTTKVTAKARILKGTAPSGTTLVTTLKIEAYDGATLLGTHTRSNITLGVGRGGKGATLDMQTERCNSGFLTFRAEFRGLDVDGDDCVGTRELRKPCS